MTEGRRKQFTTDVTYDEAWELAHKPVTSEIRNRAAEDLADVRAGLELGVNTPEDVEARQLKFKMAGTAMNAVDDHLLDEMHAPEDDVA